MNKFKLAACIFCLLTLADNAWGQQSRFIHLNIIQNPDKLPIANVNRILKDRFQFTWFASQEGLVRYDGINFIYYGKNSGNNLHDLPNNSVGAVTFSPDSNHLWVFNSFAGISKLNTCTGNVEKYAAYKKDSTVSENYFIRGSADLGTSVYFAFENGIAGKLDKLSGAVSYHNLGAAVISFGKIHNDIYCITGDYQLIIMDSAFNRLNSGIPLAQYKSDNRLQTYLNLDEYHTLVSLNKFLIQITYDAGTGSFSADRFQGLPAFSSNITTIQSAGKSLYIGLEDELLCFNRDNGETTTISADKPDAQKLLKGVLSIRQLGNQLWFGNELGLGVANMQQERFSAFTQLANSGNRLVHCYGLCRQSDPSGLFLNTTEGLYTINTSTHYGKKLSEGYYLHTFRGPDAVYFSSNTSGNTLWRETPDGITAAGSSSRLAALKKDILIDDALLGDSLWCFASLLEKGLVILHPDNRRTMFTGDKASRFSLENTNINRLFINSRKELLVLCDNLVVTLNTKGEMVGHKQLTDPVSTQPMNILHDICEVKDHYYIAVYGVGIVETDMAFNVLKIYNKSSGIENINLYKIYNVGDSLLLTSSNNGLFLLNLRSAHVSSYYETDGLHGNGFEQFSGCRINDTLVAMGGINGLTLINTNHLNPNTNRPVLYFNRISIETTTGKFDTTNLLMKQLEIPDNFLQVSIFLSGINYENPGRVTFSWMLKEKSSGWVDIGTRPFITLIGLGPGTYHLLVKATNEDGYSGEPKELILEVLPKWYQTWWFKLAVILAIAGLLYLLYRYRIKQILKVERIRQKLSNDLHDDIGSTLNSVNLFTKMEMMQPGKGEYLPQIKDGVQSAITGVRDIIWILDKEPETMESIFGRISSFSLPMAQAAGCELEVHIADDLKQYPLAAEEKRNVYLVIKEAVNNCIKYAGCKMISLKAVKENNQLVITIADDGKGFDNSGKVQVSEGGGGNGLKNMQLRCNEIRWKISISSAPGKGTTIQLSGRIKD